MQTAQGEDWAVEITLDPPDTALEGARIDVAVWRDDPTAAALIFSATVTDGLSDNVAVAVEQLQGTAQPLDPTMYVVALSEAQTAVLAPGLWTFETMVRLAGGARTRPVVADLEVAPSALATPADLAAAPLDGGAPDSDYGAGADGGTP